MARPMPRTERKRKVLEAANHMFEALEAWYDAHPDASYGDIEEEARQQRRKLMGDVLAVLINGRDAGFELQLPRCAKCGREMAFEGYSDWTVHGLEGDATLERAYYLCPECAGQGIFPPGPQTRVAPRSLE